MTDFTALATSILPNGYSVVEIFSDEDDRVFSVIHEKRIEGFGLTIAFFSMGVIDATHNEETLYQGEDVEDMLRIVAEYLRYSVRLNNLA